jgi:hypothetical protein
MGFFTCFMQAGDLLCGKKQAPKQIIDNRYSDSGGADHSLL